MNLIKKITFNIKRRHFCKLNNYDCSNCIYHKWLWGKDGVTFRGNSCRYGAKMDEVVSRDEQ